MENRPDIYAQSGRAQREALKTVKNWSFNCCKIKRQISTQYFTINGEALQEISIDEREASILLQLKELQLP